MTGASDPGSAGPSRTAAEAVSQVQRGRTVILSGNRASGKSHLLNTVGELLHDLGIQCTLIRFSTADVDEQLAALPADHVLLADDLDCAPTAVIPSVDALQAAGRTMVVTVSPDRPRTADHERSALPHLNGTEPGTAVPPHVITVAPLSGWAVAGLAHRIATQPLDSATVDAIVQLSWGRPGWAVELVRTAQAGHIATRPLARIVGLAPGQEWVDSIWPADFGTSENPLTPDQLAAAVALSGIGPRSLAGARLLVGTATVSALLTKRVLVPTPHNPRLHGVPPVMAAAIQARLDEHTLDTARTAVALKLAGLRGTGIPLSARETYFSAQAIGGTETDPAAAADHYELLRRVADDYLEFGLADDARDLILHTAGLGAQATPDDAEPDQEGAARDRIVALRTAATLHGALAANRLLMAGEAARTAARPSRRSRKDKDGLPTTPGEIGTAYLSSILRAELAAQRPTVGPLRFSRATVGRPAPEYADLCQAITVCKAWNSTAPIDDIASELLEIQSTHPVPEVVLAAAYLVDLECLLSGRLPRDAAALTERAAWLSHLALNSPPELRDLVSLCAVAEGLVTLLSGDFRGADEVLLTTAQTLPGAAFHRIWTLHLVATGQALAAGSIQRAAVEWKLFARTAPRFLPVRLRAVIDEIAQDLDDHLTDREGTATTDRLPYKLVAYVGGNMGRLSPEAQPRSALDAACDAHDVPMITLVREHLGAAVTENTARLLPVADELAVHELWGPAAHALRQARGIFAGRGATRSVTQCDERMAQLGEVARARIAWFALEAVDSAPIMRLTPRQLRAARLAADGLSNKEIAEQMHCGVRTAESHVAQARAKLGAAKRSDLADRIAALVDRV